MIDWKNACGLVVLTNYLCAWRVRWGKLPTSEVTTRWANQKVYSCIWYGEQELETAGHLFFVLTSQDDMADDDDQAGKFH